MLEASIEAQEAQETAKLAAEAASPVNPDDADKGALDGSQVAGAGEAAGECGEGEQEVCRRILPPAERHDRLAGRKHAGHLK